jgi:hypothetical protein
LIADDTNVEKLQSPLSVTVKQEDEVICWLIMICGVVGENSLGEGGLSQHLLIISEYIKLSSSS